MVTLFYRLLPRRRLVAWVLTLSMGTAGSTAFAQSPFELGQSPPPMMEIWQGNRRVDGPRPSVREFSPPPATSRFSPPPETRFPGPVEALGAPLPPLTSPSRPAVQASVPPPTIAAPVATLASPSPKPVAAVVQPVSMLEDLSKVARTAGRLVGQFRAGLDSTRNSSRPSDPSVITPIPTSGLQLVAVQPPVPRYTHEPSPVPSVVVHNEPPAVSPPPADFAPTFWIPLAAVAAVSLFAPVMVILLLAYVLRRSGIQLRVEFHGGLPLGLTLPTAPPAAVPPAAPLDPTTALSEVASSLDASTLADTAPLAEKEPEFTGEHFELGPTYEEEQQARELERLQQEKALLQRIFEENLRLRADINAIKTSEPAQPVMLPSNESELPLGPQRETDDRADEVTPPSLDILQTAETADQLFAGAKE